MVSRARAPVTQEGEVADKTPRCWASVLGGCSAKLSGEHPISKNQFGDAKTITVSGYSWCKGETKEIGISRATVKVLCTTHNSALSPLDESAGSLFDAFKCEAERRSEARRTRREFHADARRLRGDEFERWMLKSTINLALMQPPIPTAGLFEDGAPAKRYVEIAFGKGAFGPDEGLFYVAKRGDKIDGRRLGSVEFSALRRTDDDALVGSQILLHGHRLWFAVHGAPEIQNALRFRRLHVQDLNFTIDVRWSRERDRQLRGP